MESPPPAPPPTNRLPPGRAGLLCANPRCWFLVHEKPIYGGYCCKKCHYRHATNTNNNTKTKRHGLQCAQKDAPEGAPRAPEVPPDEPLKYAAFAADHLNADQLDEDGNGTPHGMPDSNWPFGGMGSGNPHIAHDALTNNPQLGANLTFPPTPVPFETVRIIGFADFHNFNGLLAIVERETEDGRYDLLLADGTRLRWVKTMNFERVAPSCGMLAKREPSKPRVTITMAPAGAGAPPPPSDASSAVLHPGPIVPVE